MCEEDLRFALALADASDTLTLKRFRADDLVVETKPDLSPVSEADRQVEEVLRRLIREKRGGEGVVGEEFGEEEGTSGRRWIIDPIDATQNYVRGIPVFATLIALQQDGEVLLGVASAPALARRWWALRGAGAFGNGAPLRVSEVWRLGDAQLSYGSLRSFETVGMGESFLALARRCARTRAFGDFWSHMLVAEGAVDVALDPIAAPWDLAALQVIVEEAGGRLTDLSGQRHIEGGNAVTTNGLLHDEVVEALSGAR